MKILSYSEIMDILSSSHITKVTLNFSEAKNSTRLISENKETLGIVERSTLSNFREMNLLTFNKTQGWQFKRNTQKERQAYYNDKLRKKMESVFSPTT